MAGDWIKMRSDLFTHPKVVRISSALKADTLRTVGGLMSVWCLFDAHSVDGTLEGYTLDVLDDHLRWPGFSQAMMSVGWLLCNEHEGLMLPRFDTHNGQSAKRRAQDADRKKVVREMSALDADKMRTREEKRREDKETNTFVDSDAVNQESAVVDQLDPEDKINRLPACPHQKILAIYSNELPALAQPRAWEGARAAALQARWKFVLTHKRPSGEPYATDLESGLDFFRRLFEYIRTKCPHLNGVNNREWQADLAWIVKAENFLKIIEGKYEVAA